MSDTQEFTFQTEIKQLLNILSHSLYQNREIAIRELISNASDSLNKLRHIQLSETQYRDDVPLEITLEPDKEAKVLVIRDSGIGLTHDELVQNLGTIAHSGSKEFLRSIASTGGETKPDLSLIGQFGVGFYSAFMLAEKVEVVTRSYREQKGWRWESDGTGRFTITEIEGDVPRGAQIRLHLKDEMDEFTEPTRLKFIIRKYSTFVPHPIKLADETLNEQKPIWVEPKSQVTEDQYAGFYQWLTHHSEEKPLWHLHLSSDSPIQFHSILYCPPSNFELLGFGQIQHGVNLCAKRVLVQDDSQDLLPDYLRFLYGVVDSADLPLNVSRETLQDHKLVPKLKKVLTKKVLDYLADLSQEQPETFKKFAEQFGSILRTGIGSDFDSDILRAIDLQDRGRRIAVIDFGVSEIGQHPDLVLLRKLHDLLIEVEVDHLRRRVGRIADHHRGRRRYRVANGTAEVREILLRRMRLDRADARAGHDEAERMQRVAGVRHDDRVARRRDRLGEVGEPLLRA